MVWCEVCNASAYSQVGNEYFSLSRTGWVSRQEYRVGALRQDVSQHSLAQAGHLAAEAGLVVNDNQNRRTWCEGIDQLASFQSF